MSEARELALLEELLRDLPGYTPELAPREQGAAFALMQSFARLTAILDEKLERLPERGLLAGLDMLGLQLLPAQAARAPLVFVMQPDAPLDITLPAGSQVAAKPAPPPPDIEAGAATSAEPAKEPVIFATERTVTLTPARLAALYSVDPGQDRYADHNANQTQGFALFENLELTPHHLYLGHDTLFKLGGRIALLISFVLEHPARAPVQLEWEYFTDAGWLPLPFNPEDDTTAGLTANGQVTLRHECGPNAKKLTIDGRESFWVRARLATPLLREGIAPLITVNDLRVRAQFGKSELKLDAAFADSQSLDVSKDFPPFGPTPTLGSSLLLACKEAFARPGATVKIGFTLSGTASTKPAGADSFALAWEYTTETGWESLTLINDSPAVDFTQGTQTVLFLAPPDWAEREVNGAKQRWVRVRIAKGDYGKPLRVDGFTNNQPTFAASNLTAPMIQRARVSFEYQTDPESLDHCVVYNDFDFTDVTEAARWPDKRFVPFTPVGETSSAVRFGFDRALPNGLVSMFLDVADAEIGSPAASPYLWEYRAAEGWRELAVLDETLGFTRRGMIQFIGPPDAVAAEGLGGKSLYWLRARAKQGETRAGGHCNGLWLNAVWASERQRHEREIVGRSDGNPGQSFPVRRAPVLMGEIVEVEEWVGRGEGWRNALPDVAERDVRFERDPATRAAVAAWVRWKARDHFFSSSGDDRHYVIERATGVIRFGAHVPAAGRRVALSYSSGGGVAGNVVPGAAKELRAAVPYLNGALNIVAARGGAQAETSERIKLRGPWHLRHRERGIAAQDIEWLALEASPEVARARCLALAGPAGHAQRGWISVAIVPRTLDGRPAPSGELSRLVHDFLKARSCAGARLRVIAPSYAPISVRAVIVPTDAGRAAVVESRVRAELDRHLHPLHGNRTGRGWQFGESVYLSKLAAVIEAVDGVDHAEEVYFSSQGVLAGMSMLVPPNDLPCAGAHELILRVGVA